MRILRIVVAFIAALAVGAQSWLLITTGEAYCLNDGCSIVEKMIAIPATVFELSIPPTLWFYGFGVLFFFLVFLFSTIAWLTDSEEVEKYVGYLLTAGLAAEGVLIFFQHAIAHTWCYSCLSVFAGLLLLTFLSGMDQTIRGILAFCAVLIAAFALQWGVGGGGLSLKAGAVASWTEKGNDKTITIIFSETCPHCEQVIDFLREESFCNINFNPIGKMEKSFDFPGAELKSYSPKASISFMQSLGIGSVPILVVPGGEGVKYQVLNGTNEIMPWVKENCRLRKEPETEAAESAESAEDTTSELPVVGTPDDGVTKLPGQSEVVLPQGAQEDEDKCRVKGKGC